MKGFKLLVPSAFLFILSCFGPARANDIGIGTGLICDTAAQTARFVALLEGNAEQALQTVNAENTGSSCTMARVAFIRGKEVARARAKDAPVSIVEIFVVGIVTPLGINRVSPRPQFTVFTIEEYSV
jgi:hypothetical protein